MDKLAELNHGAKVVLGSAILLLIFSFFNWFEVDTPLGSAGESMWNGVGFIAGLLVIGVIVWQAVRLTNMNLEIGVGPAMVTAVLSILVFIFVLIRFIDKPGGDLASDLIDRTFWAWLGLILAIVLVAGAWANMKLAGESVSDLQKLGGGPKDSPPSSPPPPSSGDDTPGS
jgi:hypothetical protein